MSGRVHNAHKAILDPEGQCIVSKSLQASANHQRNWIVVLVFRKARGSELWLWTPDLSWKADPFFVGCSPMALLAAMSCSMPPPISCLKLPRYTFMCLSLLTRKSHFPGYAAYLLDNRKHTSHESPGLYETCQPDLYHVQIAPLCLPVHCFGQLRLHLNKSSCLRRLNSCGK